MLALLMSSLKRTDEAELVKETLLTLSYFQFSCIQSDIYATENISRICHLTRTKQECFFSGLALVCDAVMNPDVSDYSINETIECHAVEMLCRALALSGWMFTMKDTVYSALGKLSTHPKFYEMVLKCGGLPWIMYEIYNRKKSGAKSSRRARALTEEEDDGTDALLVVLKQDYAVSRIQSVVRRRFTFNATKKEADIKRKKNEEKMMKIEEEQKLRNAAKKRS